MLLRVLIAVALAILVYVLMHLVFNVFWSMLAGFATFIVVLAGGGTGRMNVA
jgi:hypothetical protein